MEEVGVEVEVEAVGEEVERDDDDNGDVDERQKASKWESRVS